MKSELRKVEPGDWEGMDPGTKIRSKNGPNFVYLAHFIENHTNWVTAYCLDASQKSFGAYHSEQWYYAEPMGPEGLEEKIASIIGGYIKDDYTPYRVTRKLMEHIRPHIEGEKVVEFTARPYSDRDDYTVFRYEGDTWLDRGKTYTVTIREAT